MTDNDFNNKIAVEASHMEKVDPIGEPSLKTCIADLLRHIFDNEDMLKTNRDFDAIFMAAERLEECLTYDAPLPEKPRVVITIEGGVADVEYATEGVEVEIKDFDGDVACPNCDEGMYEGGTCPHCGWSEGDDD